MGHEANKGSGPGATGRVRPNETVDVGGAKVRNTTATSIEVRVDREGVVTVTDCCLEEQGK